MQAPNARPQSRLEADHAKSYKYRHSEKGIATRRAYAASEAGKARIREGWTRYRASEKGQALLGRQLAPARARMDQRLYGFAPGEREQLELRQGMLCAICRKPPKRRRLNVDHCHECAAVDLRASVRGLLCAACNQSLFMENPALLRAAADYFEAHIHAGSLTKG